MERIGKKGNAFYLLPLPSSFQRRLVGFDDALQNTADTLCSLDLLSIHKLSTTHLVNTTLTGSLSMITEMLKAASVQSSRLLTSLLYPFNQPNRQYKTYLLSPLLRS